VHTGDVIGERVSVSASQSAIADVYKCFAPATAGSVYACNVHARALQRAAQSSDGFARHRLDAFDECLRQCCFAPPQLGAVRNGEKHYSEPALTLILEVLHTHSRWSCIADQISECYTLAHDPEMLLSQTSY
jgi:hypothetical protein